jgi:hypothetical protein
MSKLYLADPIEAFVQVANAQDTQALVACFRHDAVVRDEGRDRHGAARCAHGPRRSATSTGPCSNRCRLHRRPTRQFSPAAFRRVSGKPRGLALRLATLQSFSEFVGKRLRPSRSGAQG